MLPSLDDLLEAVIDEFTFVKFVAALGADFALERVLETKAPSDSWAAGALGWENITVDAVFESATAWANDTTNIDVDRVNQNPWKRCAHILYAGKFYE